MSTLPHAFHLIRRDVPNITDDVKHAIAESMKLGPDFDVFRHEITTYAGLLFAFIVLGMTLGITLFSVVSGHFLKKRTTTAHVHSRRPRLRTTSSGAVTSKKRRSRMFIGNRMSVYSARSFATGWSTASEFGKDEGGRIPSIPALPSNILSRPSDDGSHHAQGKRNYSSQRVSFLPPPPDEPLPSTVVVPQPPQHQRYSIATVATSPPVLESTDAVSQSRPSSSHRRSWFSFSGTSAPKPILHIRPRRSPGTFVVASAEDEHYDDDDDWWEDEEIWGNVEVLDTEPAPDLPPNSSASHSALRDAIAVDIDPSSSRDGDGAYELMVRNKREQSHQRRTWHIQEVDAKSSSESSSGSNAPDSEMDELDWLDLYG
ncbi:uncharacterized protein SPPG_02660 [Spizellomyces punctatus DAOM BR117]|uniref:Uncharacterized protein n=1 Tax=Spizellomyces punctatus (strain DAOM BR117) TaxID=645134 RepID=A0A0L0HM82_SPIPD|nr:uncharacterized protein SPPG_02660 [Spizellomyces punctatus DAOM BR117]KND02168.1 hypothetical protein SPPG_02660 [Spizellomyces punctatus DAOM BR117]|eukprot:XP_016610207.1 hypothetical protein SPPG_02660 [Spizellomyces punctatus DAOM BR117]